MKPRKTLYDVAREICHKAGFPWTDPGTLKTYPPPEEGSCAMTPCRLREGVWSRWLIIHPTDDQMAWTGRSWSSHWRGIPAGQYQVCNFETEQAARDYCTENGLQPQDDNPTARDQSAC